MYEGCVTRRGGDRTEKLNVLFSNGGLTGATICCSSWCLLAKSPAGSSCSSGVQDRAGGSVSEHTCAYVEPPHGYTYTDRRPDQKVQAASLAAQPTRQMSRGGGGGAR
eukprot:GDKI01006208.1.p2 GENE.GDKI01006208.1~~GDKI01006208.1.p2  ORF type:complete len:108 (-),score=4.68 GDKI01006208.1:102-425(-)